MKTIVTSLSLLLFSVMLSAQTNVVPRLSNDAMPQGIVYHLPMTSLNIEAKAECIISKPGPFFRYAERFFAENDVIVEEKTEWRLIGVNVVPMAEPNPKMAFDVVPDKKGEGISNLISFTPNGLMKGLNLLPPPAKRPHAKHKKPGCTEVPRVEFNMSVLGEEVLVANSIPKMAEIAAKQVYRIRESRMAILNGEMDVLPSGDAMKHVLAKMDEVEADILALFFGRTVSYVTTRTYELDIEDDMTKQVLFRISALEGLLSADNIIGDPVYISLKGTYPLAPTPPEKAPKVLGFAYTVPGTAEVMIFDNAHTLAEETVKVPQFGYVLHLNPSITDDANARIVYNDKTGEILSISK